VLAAAGLLLVPLLAAGMPPRGTLRSTGTGEQLISAALHMHSSFSEGSGSMEWQLDKAMQNGVDLIWWTDHDWRVSNWQHTRRYDFESAFFDPVEQRVEEPDDAYPGEFRYWSPGGSSPVTHTESVVDSLSFEGGRSLRLALDPSTNQQFLHHYLKQSASLFQNVYSLSARVRLRFALWPEALDATDGRFVVLVRLSEHPEGQPELRYVAGCLDGEPASTTSLPYTTGTWNEYRIDVTDDAIALLSTGGADSLRVEDNAMFEVRIGLESRNSHRPVVFFDDYRIEIDSTLTGADFVDKQRVMADRYSGAYPGVSQVVGTEISRYRAQPHLNGYSPDLVLVDYGSHVWSDSLYYAVEQIHGQKGAVSLNHFFGSGIYGDTTETPEHKAARVLTAKAGLIGNRAYGVDMLEVGYRWRGGIQLPAHLDLWDALNANAVFLTGIGVTDSHGPGLFNGWGPWQPSANFENNFVTWLYVTDLAEPALIRAMKAGRAFFGDPYRFGGSIDLATTEAFPMGSVVLTDRPSHDLIVDVTGVPPDVEVHLLQAEVRDDPPTPYLDVHYLRDEILTGAVQEGVFADTVTVDTGVASFVRVELYGAGGEEWAFSNPIHFLRAPPAAGIPAERLRARIGPVAIRSAENFTLTAASFVPFPPVLKLDGDEPVTGLGEMVVDPGVLGAPAAVLGAAVWNYANGMVHLAGFQGAGSQIQVFWTLVGADLPDTVAELTLEPGRPNPFGSGISTAFALPVAQHVRLEVYDVRGRRVRTLVDGLRDAGRHRADWNGRDYRGRPVSNGVYVLRLETASETLTMKAVKVD